MFKSSKPSLTEKSRPAVAANKTDVRVAGSAAKSKPAAATRKTAARSDSQVRGTENEEDRQEMIAIAAYYRAERRGFNNGYAMQDWLEAEAEIDGAVYH